MRVLLIGSQRIHRPLRRRPPARRPGRPAHRARPRRRRRRPLRPRHRQPGRAHPLPRRGPPGSSSTPQAPPRRRPRTHPAQHRRRGHRLARRCAAADAVPAWCRSAAVPSTGPASPAPPPPRTPYRAPAAPYGVSKLAATELILGSGLDAVVLRVFSPAGPGTPAGSPLGRLAEAMRRAMQAGDGELKLGGLGVQARLRGRTRCRAGRARRLALRRTGGDQHRLRPRRPARETPPPSSRAWPDTAVPSTNSTPRPGRCAAPSAIPGPTRAPGPRWRTRTRTAAAAGSRPTCAPRATGSAGGPASTSRNPLADIWMEAACRI